MFSRVMTIGVLALIAVAGAGFGLAIADAPSTTLRLVPLDGHPRALCGSGSPASYGYRAGRSDRWLVLFEAGVPCRGPDHCRDRLETAPGTFADPYHDLGQRTLEISGIAADPAFADWHVVRIGNCSRDLWLGSGRGPGAPDGLSFHGRDILAAVLADITDPAHPGGGLGAGSELLLAGASAGAIGLAANRARFEVLPVAHRRYLFDSYLSLPTAQTNSAVPASNLTALLGGIPDHCGGSDGIFTRCAPSPAWIAANDLDAMVVIGRDDPFLYPFRLPPDREPPDLTAELAAALARLGNVYSAASGQHALLESADWFEPHDGLSPARAVQRWLAGEPVRHITWQAPPATD